MKDPWATLVWDGGLERLDVSENKPVEPDNQETVKVTEGIVR